MKEDNGIYYKSLDGISVARVELIGTHLETRTYSKDKQLHERPNPLSTEGKRHWVFALANEYENIKTAALGLTIKY